VSPGDTIIQAKQASEDGDSANKSFFNIAIVNSTRTVSDGNLMKSKIDSAVAH
jgi:hypothetical protein